MFCYFRSFPFLPHTPACRQAGSHKRSRMNSSNFITSARTIADDIRHSRIVELATLLDSRLEEHKDFDKIADELEALLDEQTDEETLYTIQYFECAVVQSILPLDILIYIDYTRIKIARAYRDAFSFLSEKCPSKLRAPFGLIEVETGRGMRRLLEAMRDPRAAPLAQALARFL